MNRQDDLNICGDMILFRRIPPWKDNVTWGDDGIPGFSSGNFVDKVNELFVHIAAETTPDAILKGHEQFGLVQITAQQIRDAYGKFEKPVVICRDPDDPANGHVLICGKPSQAVKRQLKEYAKWVDGRWPAKLSENP